MSTLCIAPCGDRKIWKNSPDAGPQKARYVYTGPFASTCIAYADKFYSDWCILSAKYGFLFPDELIPGPYDVTFKKKSTNPVSLDKLLIQVENKNLFKFDQLVVLGGKEYSDIISKVFPFTRINKPLEGLKLGIRISKMKKAIREDFLLL